MSFFLPFNHRPATSVTVYTDGNGQQTIAANTYARVVANVYNAGSFLVNGTAVLSSYTGGDSYNSVTNTTGTLITAALGRHGIIVVRGTGSITINVAGSTINAITVTPGTEYAFGDGDTLVQVGSATVAYQYRYTDGLAAPQTADFWLDAGDTCEINGNGAMSVEVYPIT